MAGKVVTENKNAAAIPIEVMLPKSWKGGTSLVFMDKKPIIVVRLVMNTGIKLTLKLSTIASLLFIPFLMDCIMVIRM